MNDYIAPKNKELDEERDKNLLKEKQDYDAKLAVLQEQYNAKISQLNSACDLQKQAYKDQIFNTISAEIKKEFESTIKLLDSQLNK